MQEMIIEPNQITKIYLKDLIKYRELFYFFAWRDILVRYKQAVLGIAWALIRPLLNTMVFVILFGRIAKLADPGAPYPLFVMCALLPWQLISSSINDGGLSLLSNSSMMSKIYFPRMIVPCSIIAVNLVDMLISFVFFFIVALYYHYSFSLSILLIPLLTLQTVILCAAASIWIAALVVKYRDFKFIIPFVTQFGLFISPVGYSTGLISESYRYIYILNPLVGIIDAFRWVLFGIGGEFVLQSWVTSMIVTAFLLITGFLYFRKMERYYADII
jgi:lipopolysaccharide transport system permease protein